MPIRVEALEPDIALPVLVLDQLHAIGEQVGAEAADVVWGRHGEAEMGEAPSPRGRSVVTKRKGEAIGIMDDDHAVGVSVSCSGVKPEVPAVEVDRALLLTNR